MAQVLPVAIPSSPQELLSLFVLPLLLFLLLHYYFSRSTRSARRQQDHGRRLPPSPPKLPFIGHLHLVGSDPHLSLSRLSRKHGGPDGLMLLHLGQVRNLVVSTPSATEAIMRTHDLVFSSRPPNALAEILLEGVPDVAFAPYGEYWRQTKRLVTTHLLSAKKVQSLRRGREEEVRLVVAKIGEAARAGAAVDMSELLSCYTNDVACRAVSGKFFREGGRNKLFQEVIDGNVVIFGGFNLEDYFPTLAKVSMLTRVMLTRTHKLKNKWDGLLDVIIDDHESKSSLHHQQHDHQEDQQRDFVDVLLGLRKEFGLTRQHVKAILMDMFVAGTDTSYVVLEFAMAELMRKPQLMAKLQAEVIEKTPKEQEMVTEDELSSMGYLKAVLRETLRLHPPLPLLLPHQSVATCDVNGYTVPAETRIIVNAWALGRDSGAWEDAEEFKPERFMDAAAADYKGLDFQFLPFGAGRRICPGINFGMASVEIMLANLLHSFRWELPRGMRHEDVDMTGVFGMTMRRKQKLLLVPVRAARSQPCVV